MKGVKPQYNAILKLLKTGIKLMLDLIRKLSIKVFMMLEK